MNRQTSKATFKAIEREIRANPDMASYIRQTYLPGTIIRQIADKSLKTDELSIKALEIELFGTSWYQTALKAFKSGR